MTARELTVDVGPGSVSARLDGPEDAASVVVLAPGASGGMDSEFMRAVADGLAARGRLVARFNFLFTEQGRRAPDRAGVLEDTYRAAATTLTRRAGDRPVVLGGKSMGGRIASQIVSQGYPAAGLLFLGYPLHPPGKPQGVRSGHLAGIDIPMLFIEGTRDPFCPLDTLERVLSESDAPAEVAVIADGDHSFKLRRSSGRTTAQAWDEVVAAADSWLDARVHPRGPRG